MTQDEIIEMAKQAGFEEHQAKFDTRFEPFAKLVAEKEREAWRNAAIRVGENLATCGPAGYYNYTSQQWLDWALDATTKMQDDYMNLGACGEREACAKVCEEYETNNDIADTWLNIVSEVIKARGQA
jgi:hypothetical protein